MKRVLHIMVGSGSYGGAEQFAISYYEKMERSRITFDFLFLHENVLKSIKKDCLAKSQISELGTWKIKGNGPGDYVRTVKGIIKVIKQGKYNIVHVNSGIIRVQMICLLAAKLAGVKIRIAHSHTAKAEGKRGKESIGERVKTWVVRSLATDYFGCSQGAGEYLFGRKGLASERFRIVPNAIDLDKYTFDESKRQRVRTTVNEVRTPVFAHIGRFIEVKNQKFVVAVFDELHKLLPDSCLWMIGDGELLEEMKNKAQDYGLTENIRFFGERNDVPDLLQAMDAIIFPSFHEGLSIVVVESQAAGVEVFAADTLSPEHVLSDHIQFLSLKDTPSSWAKRIAGEMKSYHKSSNQEKLVAAGYDINQAANSLEEFYLKR